jgi:hypothetical protein
MRPLRESPLWIGIAALAASTLAGAWLWHGRLPTGPLFKVLGLAPWPLTAWALWACRDAWRAWPLWLKAAAGVILSSLLVMALTPLTARDGMAFHLAFPRRLLRGGPDAFWGGPAAFDTYYTFIPLVGHMLYLLSLAWSESTALLWLPLCWLGTLWGLRRIGKELDPDAPERESGWLVLSCLPLTRFAAGGYLDVAATCAAAFSLVAFLRWLSGGRDALLAASGLLAGALPALKPTGLFFPGILLALLVFLRSGRLGDRKQRAAACLAFALCALAVIAPWLARNWIATGNPFYYLARHGGFFARLGGPFILRDNAYALGTGLTRLAWLTLPAVLLASAPWLGILGLAACGRRLPKDPRLPVLWAMLLPVPLIAAASYCSVENVVRWSLPYLLPSCVLGQMAWRRLDPGWPARSAKAIVVAGLLAAAAFGAGRIQDRGGVLVGLESREAFLSRKIETYRATAFLNGCRPGRVMIVGALDYYVQAPFLHARDDHGFTPFAALKGIPDFLVWMPDDITHLLVERLPGGGRVTFLRWLARDGIPSGLQLVYKDPGALVFKIPRGPPAAGTGTPPAP